MYINIKYSNYTKYIFPIIITFNHDDYIFPIIITFNHDDYIFPIIITFNHDDLSKYVLSLYLVLKYIQFLPIHLNNLYLLQIKVIELKFQITLLVPYLV